MATFGPEGSLEGDNLGVAGASLWLDRPCFDKQVASEVLRQCHWQVHKRLDHGRFIRTDQSELAGGWIKFQKPEDAAGFLQ